MKSLSLILLKTAFLILAACLLSSLGKSRDASHEFPEQLEIPLGLQPIPWPEDNPYTPQKAALGRLLYFDKRLSSDSTISCASCHQVKRAFSDIRPYSQGVHGRLGLRHAPSLINSAYNTTQFWDGRAKTLEIQCTGPLSNPLEMTLVPEADIALKDCAKRINKIAGYRKLFKDVFGQEEVSMDNISKAIATFERTILSGNSAYDRYAAGDKTALSEEQLHGLKVFKQAKCAACHGGFNFTDGRFTNIGVGMDSPHPDVGRFDVTHEGKDYGAFKIPTLREVSHTAPYMHNGSLKTLEEVVEFYDKGGIPNKSLSTLIRPLHLSKEDKKALVSFLNALNGEGWQHFSPPDKFPE